MNPLTILGNYMEFPMHVGMNRYFNHFFYSFLGVPHARGDEPRTGIK